MSITNMTEKELANMIDHTLLKAYAKDEDFRKLCQEAADNHFKMVAINSSAVKTCKKYLEGTSVSVGAAISFPLGQTTIETKVFETENAIQNGADEIDYVVNIVELKNRNYSYIEDEMKQIVDVCKKNHVTIKVIFENCYLSQEEKVFLCHTALKVQPDFIKTSTGFGTGGATVADVSLMKSIVGDHIKVKAAGGIRDLETAMKMVEAGAERIGTSSGVKIMQEYCELIKKQ